MHKIILWSNLLDEALDETEIFQEFIEETLSYYIKEEYYKCLSLNVVRCGSPYYNEFNSQKIKPYTLNISLPEVNDLDVKFVLEQRLNNKLHCLQDEYTVWNKMKKKFENFGLNFIEVKTFFESDVVNYFKCRTLVELLNQKDLNEIQTPLNPPKAYLNNLQLVNINKIIYNT